MKARKWVIYCASDEWGNAKMEELAREKFAADATLDCIEVYEHAGWHLTFNRDMVIVGTANDMAVLSKEAVAWKQQFIAPGQRYWDCEIVGYQRRGEGGYQHVYDCYWPCIAAVA